MQLSLPKAFQLYRIVWRLNTRTGIRKRERFRVKSICSIDDHFPNFLKFFKVFFMIFTMIFISFKCIFPYFNTTQNKAVEVILSICYVSAFLHPGCLYEFETQTFSCHVTIKLEPN